MPMSADNVCACVIDTVDGLAEIVKSGAAATVSDTVVVRVIVPSVPDIVTVVVPMVADAFAENVHTLVHGVFDTGFGENDALTPVGSPVGAVSVTPPVQPAIGPMVMVVVPVLALSKIMLTPA
jgi:hypothetical protein